LLSLFSVDRNVAPCCRTVTDFASDVFVSKKILNTLVICLAAGECAPPPPAEELVWGDPLPPELEQPATAVARMSPAQTAARRMGSPMRTPLRVKWFVPLTNELEWEIASR
jgi:hypothetical protein